jgi:hypothetical protein
MIPSGGEDGCSHEERIPPQEAPNATKREGAACNHSRRERRALVGMLTREAIQTAIKMLLSRRRWNIKGGVVS